MSSLQNLLAVIGILITGEAIADFCAEHTALITGLGCLIVFVSVSASLYHSRKNGHH